GEMECLLKLKEKDISVIPLAPPSQEGEPVAPDMPLRRPYLLYVGGYDERKNVPALMEAFQKHIANHYSIDLILVGAKGRGLETWLTDRYQERVAGKIPVKPKGGIIFTPPLAPAELSALYRQATALTHVSYYEGFNLPLVEAMSHGIPIVAADIPVNREVTAQNAVFVDPFSIDSIGLGIHEFLNHKSLQKDLKEKSLARAGHFSWKKCAEETLYVYNLFA
ncbi:glycosyltransferase family 4 protein, partial [Candidatus Peregrinibacteria bacterium]|nr:glycosyltransferase family 4 protein [Candidatus Peregrinibacteria bacterium]